MLNALFQASFVFPVVAGVSAFLLPRQQRSVIGYGFFALGGIVAAGAALASLFAPQISGALPALSAFFFGIIGVGVFLSALYAIAYVPRYPAYEQTWVSAAYAAFVLGMLVVVSAPSVLVFLLGWECMSIAAYLLILADGASDSLKAGLMYLVMTQLGFAAIASGMLIMAGGAPLSTWADVAAYAATLSPAGIAAVFVLLFAGFGSKAGLVPLHQWLPYAHPQAPSHVSALLSGVMLKVALFGFIEMVLLLPPVSFWLAVVVVVVGLVSAFFGALHAAVEDDAKRLLAWSSIENMGLIFSALGAALALGALEQTPLTQVLVAGAVVFMLVHTVNHFLFKTSLFLAAGTVVAETHTRDLDSLGGLAKRWPVFSGVVLALALAAAALPPFGTFFGEWAYLQTLAVGFHASVPVAIAAAIILGIIGLVAGLALFAFVKLFASIFLGRARSTHAEHVEKLPLLLVLSPALGALALLASGPFIFPALGGILSMPGSGAVGTVTVLPGASINPILTIALLVGALGVALLARTIIRSRLLVRVTGIWDCGSPLTPRMEQTATGFAASIRFFFRALVLSENQMVATPIVATNPWIAARRLVWSTGSFWERRAYEPLVAFVFHVSRRVRRLQGGVIQAYLFLMFLTLVIVLAIAL